MSNGNQSGQSREHFGVLTERFLGGSRVLGTIVGIIMIIFGVLFIANPLEMALVLDILVTLGFLLFGIYQIASYVSTPAGLRSGWQLAFGIVWVLMAVLIVASGAIGVILSFAFVLGFLALLSGFMQLSVHSLVRGQAGAGMLLASAIINIVLGLLLLALPFFATAAVAIAQGIYLIAAGLALIFEALSGHAHKVK